MNCTPVVLVEVDPEDAVCVGDPLSDPAQTHVEQHVQGQVEAEGQVHETELGRVLQSISWYVFFQQKRILGAY